RAAQVAFGATAWQALPGSRRFAGSTLEQLRRATLEGIANVPAKMPSGVRAVLARALAADPNARWPSMDAMLTALERTVRRRQLRSAVVWSVVGTAVIVSALVGIQLLVQGRSSAPQPTSPLACVPAEQAFADVWSPERRAALEQRVPHDPTVAAIADAL